MKAQGTYNSNSTWDACLQHMSASFNKPTCMSSFWPLRATSSRSNPGLPLFFCLIKLPSGQLHCFPLEQASFLEAAASGVLHGLAVFFAQARCGWVGCQCATVRPKNRNPKLHGKGKLVCDDIRTKAMA